MSDINDDLDAFLAEAGVGPEDQATAQGVAEAAIQAAERRALLEGMAARGGTLGEVAKELLAIAHERAEKAERDARVAELEAAAAQGEVDLDDPAVQDQLRAAVLGKRSQDEASFLRLHAQAQVAKGATEEDAARIAREAAMALPSDSWFWSRDPLGESEAFLAHLANQAVEARAKAHVEGGMRKPEALMGEVAAAEAAIAETRARIAEGA